jgi:hypothetical protein
VPGCYRDDGWVVTIPAKSDSIGADYGHCVTPSLEDLVTPGVQGSAAVRHTAQSPRKRTAKDVAAPGTLQKGGPDVVSQGRQYPRGTCAGHRGGLLNIAAHLALHHHKSAPQNLRGNNFQAAKPANRVAALRQKTRDRRRQHGHYAKELNWRSGVKAVTHTTRRHTTPSRNVRIQTDLFYSGRQDLYHRSETVARRVALREAASGIAFRRPGAKYTGARPTPLFVLLGCSVGVQLLRDCAGIRLMNASDFRMSDS